jgi:hypothetical protein
MATSIGGENSSRNGDGSANEQREKRQLQCGWVTLKNNATDWRLEFKRVAKITVRDLREIVAVLREDGLIQAERVPKLLGLAGGGTFTEHLLDRIAGDDMDQQENECQHQPERRQRKQEAVKYVAQ